MNSSKNKFTKKIVFSYLLLVILALVASFYVFSEIQDYLSTEAATENDAKLLKTSSFLTHLYEAESLSKLALQSKSKKNFTAYALKIDSIYTDIQQLKALTKSEQQQHLLDSLQLLLEKKVANNEALRKLKTQNQTSTAITSALREFDQMEASLGIITAEALAPNLKELSPKAQEAIKKVAQYLNENIPSEENTEQRAKKVDSVLQVSKSLLKEVQEENTMNMNSLAQREIAINKTDMELSQKLRNIISSFEKEIMVNSFNDNLKKEAALKRSIRLAIIAALLVFLVVATFIFILNRDFWKAHLYRQKLEKEKKYSESLLKSREQLITTVSHDLRTPLNAISGYTELIENSGMSNAQKQHVNHIKSATTYVNNLVNDLLDFSRLEAGKMTPEKIPFNLSKLLTETAKNIAATQPNKDIELSLKIDASLDQTILNDPLRIQQILSNLIGNAYKFTQMGKVTLTASLLEKEDLKPYVKISVTDTGIGISKNQQKFIFKEFAQAQNETEKKYSGYGLGLTISKKLTQLLGGAISVDSVLGEGSVFSFKLPIVFDTTAKVTSKKTKHDFKENRIKLLVIDDDDSFLQMIGEMAKTEHLETFLCNDFNTIDKRDVGLHYDIILTDIEMPSLSGFDVISQLKTGEYVHYKNQPILAMTGRHDLQKELFVSHGFNDVLKKPFHKSKLLNTIFFLLKEKPKNPLKIEEEITTANSHELYDLEIINSFLGDDLAALEEVLHTFVKDTKDNKAQLRKAVLAKRFDDLNKTAHKMLPMFRQLRVMDSISILESFEVADSATMTEKELKNDYKKLENIIEKLLLALEKENLIHPNYSG